MGRLAGTLCSLVLLQGIAHEDPNRRRLLHSRGHAVGFGEGTAQAYPANVLARVRCVR